MIISQIKFKQNETKQPVIINPPPPNQEIKFWHAVGLCAAGGAGTVYCERKIANKIKNTAKQQQKKHLRQTFRKLAVLGEKKMFEDIPLEKKLDRARRIIKWEKNVPTITSINKLTEKLNRHARWGKLFIKEPQKMSEDPFFAPDKDYYIETYKNFDKLKKEINDKYLAKNKSRIRKMYLIGYAKVGLMAYVIGSLLVDSYKLVQSRIRKANEDY